MPTRYVAYISSANKILREFVRHLAIGEIFKYSTFVLALPELNESTQTLSAVVKCNSENISSLLADTYIFGIFLLQFVLVSRYIFWFKQPIEFSESSERINVKSNKYSKNMSNPYRSLAGF